MASTGSVLSADHGGLELQGNDNTSETETYVTMEVETEVQNEKMDPEAFSKTPDGTTATISRAQKVNVSRGCQGRT